MTKVQKITKLLEAIENGYVLYTSVRQPLSNESPESLNPNSDYLRYLYKGSKDYEIRGWGSTFTSAAGEVYSLIQKPDDWSIFPNFNLNINSHPYPWSHDFKLNNNKHKFELLDYEQKNPKPID